MLLHGFVSELLTVTDQVLRKFAELGINDQNGLRVGMRQLQFTLSKTNIVSSSRPMAAASVSH